MRLITLLFVCFTTLLFCQNSNETSILTSHENWDKEVISFPVDWAPKINLTGFEELRFAPYWSNTKSEQFWSLVMAWKVDAKSKLAIGTLEYNFEAYFEGLMIPNQWATTFPRPTVIFVTNPEENTANSIIGKMKFFDGFHTGKLLTLNIKVEQHFCTTENKVIVVFRFSPKNFDHKIWDELLEIKHKTDKCY